LTNGYGYYCIKLKKGATTLQFSYVGYTKQELIVPIKMGAKLDVALKPNITLKEVVLVSSLVEKKVQEAPNQQNILTKKLSTYPSLGGEPDLFRQLQGLPGVQSGADGFGGLHIRGGNADQNLILLDDVPVFNPSHTSGLFSIFNTNLVKSAVLTKGGFPARYGGRLSSVLDVRTKEGSFDKTTASVGVGFIATSLAVETPIVKDKVSILLGGRRSHLDGFLRNRSIKAKEEEGETGTSDYYFYDANAKLNFKLTDKDRLYLSFYAGGDQFADSTKIVGAKRTPKVDDALLSYRYDWGNRIGSLRWNHIFGNKLFSNTTLVFSRFDYKTKTDRTIFLRDTSGIDLIANQWNTTFGSLIEERALRTDFDYFSNEKHRIKTGFGITQRNFTPTVLSKNNEIKLTNNNAVVLSRKENLGLDSIVYRGAEGYAYISDEWKTGNWEINAGLHAALFSSQNHNPLSLQPRFSARYYLNQHTALSISGARMTQFLHLLTTTDAGLPNDLWVPSTQKATPENAWLGTLGVHQELGKNWLLNAEIYHKKMTSLPAFTDTIVLKDNKIIDANTWEDLVQIGTGTASGLEILMEKHKGNWTGWVAYTLSKTSRTFKNKEEAYRFDSRHTFHANISYHLGNVWEATAAWSYQSGLPIADFEQLRDNFIFKDLFQSSPSTIQNNRLPAYHRLDCGINANFDKKKFKHSISIGAYNAYNRKNAFLSFSTSSDKKAWTQINALPLMPSIRYVLTVN
jgi:hypothetical protein